MFPQTNLWETVDFAYYFSLLSRYLVFLFLIGVISIFIIYTYLGYSHRIYKRFPGSNLHPLLEILIIFKIYFQNKHLERNIWNLQLLSSWCQVYRKEGLFRSYLGIYPVIVIYRADILETFLTSNVNICKQKGYKFLNVWLKDGLLTSTGEKWRARRKLLTPSFHFKILEDFFPIFNDHCSVMLDIMKNLTDKEWVDIIPIITKCNLDINCETAMGIKLNSQIYQDRGYRENLEKVGELFLSRAIKPWLWFDFLFFCTSTGKHFQRHAQGLKDFGEQVFAERKEEFLSKMQNKSCDGDSDDDDDNDNTIKERKRSRKAFMDLLLHHYFKDRILTKADILNEINLFMFAGHDTTAFNLSWTLYLLGLHQNIQKKLQEEFDSFFGEEVDTPVQPNHLKHFKYLDCVIKEVLRLYPSIPFIARDLLDDVKIGDHYIPKGTSCIFFLYQLHRDPDVFPNPEIFDPDRFSAENCHNRNPFAFLPFSAGPRNCIGQRYALLVVKVILIRILRKYSFISLDPRDRVHVGGEIVLRPKVPLRLKIIPRKR